MILLPEIPYDPDKVNKAILDRAEKQKRKFSIVVVAEGAFSQEEAKMKRKERLAKRAEMKYPSVSYMVAEQIQQATGFETRVCNPGHYLRGGSPSAYDRVLATIFGTYAAHLIKDENYGQTVAAGKTKCVDPESDLVKSARDIGVSVGD